VDPDVILPLGSSILSFVFAALVADQWLSRRQPFQLAWTIGLLWYGISAGTEFLGSAFGWSEALYRSWYLIGAFGVAAYLGLGTVLLLNRTRFGYFVAVSFLIAGVLSFLTSVKYAREGTPPSPESVAWVVGLSIAAAIGTTAVTRFDRRWVGPLTSGILVVASVVVTVLSLTVPVAAPGYALDPTGNVPIGAAMPADLRILTPPFNIVGAFALVFGAVYSAYIFMPKRRVLRVSGGPPLIGAVGRAVAIAVNFVASVPGAWRALRDGRLNSRVPATILIALGGFIPGWTSGLNRFGVTWSFFLGEFVGVLLIFLGFLVSTEVFSDVRLPFTRIVLVRRDRMTNPEEARSTS
jgi:multisubunit Na+/H+ antiporter MnhC subunit